MSRRVHSIADESLGNTAYLIDVGDGAAVVVDPRRDAGYHVAVAQKLRLRIVGVLETHLHADFVSGSREVANSTDAGIVASGRAGLSFAHRAVEDGSQLSFGDAVVEVLGSPGHTPEHISFLITVGNERMLFSGGSLIVGGAARTDLSGDDKTDGLARAQFATLRRLTVLPDDTALFPTHGAGSFCSTGPTQSASSTIGTERASNPLFTITDEDEFVRQLTSGFGSYPRYFAHLRDVNRAGAPLLETLPPVPQISAAAARDTVDSGAWLIDGRSAEDWARSHAQGSISVAVRPAFASWLGWVVPFGAPVVLILEPDLVEEALRQAHLIGYDRIEGWTTIGDWLATGLLVSSTKRLSAEQAAKHVNGGALLLDIRRQPEFDAKHIEGAAHLELGEIIAGKTPDASEVITYCGHGERAATAASLLARRARRVATLPGGTSEWRRAGFPVQS
ncbi:MAG: rhodanese-like domain-containing protein [Actinomycetota bacterium]|nr:MBL fold metallo-hydrolase [Actinomycetota bacterium]